MMDMLKSGCWKPPEREASYRIDYSGEGEKKISMTSSGISMNGKAFFPIMGELQYSRIPRMFWKEHLLKMKSAGINVIATYVFWIHHEERKGRFNWEGRRDLRAFLELCRNLGFSVFLRMGPWCHGEVRNGGFPDWLRWGILRKRGLYPRYMRAVEDYFSEVLHQCRSLSWNDGGPILGVQIENEFHIRSKGDAAYLMHLKQMIIQGGLKVPVYALTGWPLSAHFPHREFLPFWGDYPATPWASHTAPVNRERSFRFSLSQIPEDIGTDLLRKSALKEKTKTLKNNPYALVELGLSNQISDKRRPSFTRLDGYAMALVKAGSGASWMGYYMFSGGTNPMGEKGSLEENRATLYPNTYPKLSYDFHAPLGEWGQLKPSYYPVKNLHFLLRDFAALLLKGSKTWISDTYELSWSYRGGADGGFIFINRYRRGSESKGEINKHTFSLPGPEGEGKTLIAGINLPADVCAVLPAGLKTGYLRLEWAGALPLGTGFDRAANEYFFGQIRGINPCFAFAEKPDITSDADAWQVRETEAGQWEVSPVELRACMVLSLRDSAGNPLRYVLLSEQWAERYWKDYESGMILWGPDSVLFQRESIEMEFSEPLSSYHIWNSRTGDFTSYENQGKEPLISVSTTYRGKRNGKYIWDISPDYSRIESLPESVGELILSLEYSGDKAELFIDGDLSTDHFNQGYPWEISLSRLLKCRASIPSKMELRIKKRSILSAVYIEGPLIKKDLTQCQINHCRIKSIYKVTHLIKTGELNEQESQEENCCHHYCRGLSHHPCRIIRMRQH